MRLLSNLHVKGKPAVLPDRAIRSQSHYFIYRPCIISICCNWTFWLSWYLWKSRNRNEKWFTAL